MQPSTIVHGVPFRQKPRSGQMRVFDEIVNADHLCIQLPTGYGKTLTACGAYAIKQRQGVNRALFIFPTEAQLLQFRSDGHRDLADAGVIGTALDVVDIRYYGVEALKKSRNNSVQVFAITVQALCGSAGQAVVNELMASLNWMVVVDEYHHYGVEKTWGKSVLALPYKCLLAMSATPNRPGEDSAFGLPEIRIPYTDAVAEGAVKPLYGHAYHYVLDTVGADGTIRAYTSKELTEQVGSDSPDKIQKFMIERKMRWSPKYISPLITTPLARLQSERVRSGIKQQAIVGAMCVSHAQMVCDQIKSQCEGLTVDWVGTGDDGRSPADNARIIKQFCPPKDEYGERHPTLDVLVHVGMAGEGLDAVSVTEVIHLNAASLCNSNNQENGRASRYCGEFPDGKPIGGHINFDGSSDYARSGYIGPNIMNAMDLLPPSEHQEPEPRNGSFDIPELPELPTIRIFDLRLDHIDSGDAAIQETFTLIKALGGSKNLDIPAMERDLKHTDWEHVISFHKTMRERMAMEHDEVAVINQWKDSVKDALSTIAQLAAGKMTAKGVRSERTLVGDISKRINTEKKLRIGPIKPDVDIYKRHYEWLVVLDKRLRNGEIPAWLC